MYRILVTDDDSMILKMMRHLLTPEGFEILTCSDGQSAIKSALEDKPDLMILDVNLPDMEGHDVCRAIKADARVRHIPILMLTGEARSVEMRVSGLDLGADDYLFKPVSGNVLVSRIKAILKIATKPTK